MYLVDLANNLFNSLFDSKCLLLSCCFRFQIYSIIVLVVHNYLEHYSIFNDSRGMLTGIDLHFLHQSLTVILDSSHVISDTFLCKFFFIFIFKLHVFISFSPESHPPELVMLLSTTCVLLA